MTREGAASASTPPKSGPVDVHVLDRVADFLTETCKSDELDERLEIEGASGGVLRVVESLNALLDKMWVKQFQLAAKQEMLEKVIEIRTNEVHEILDHVSTGFLLTLRDESVLDNFSRCCADIFGVPDLRGRKLSELLRLGERERAHFSMCYEQIFDGFLPPEVCTGQLPSELVLDSRTYRIDGAPVLGNDGRVAKVFFTITDTTHLRKVEAENVLRQALVEIIRQRDTFKIFLSETSQAFGAARDWPSQARMRNLLHTLKGNVGCYGLHDIAALVHSIEDAPEITPQHLSRVEDTLKRFVRTHEALLRLTYPEPEGRAPDSKVERMRPILTAIAEVDSKPARQAAVDDFLRKATWVTAGALLAPLRGVVERVAGRLEKEVSFVVTGQEVLVDPDRVRSVFSNLVHLVRNSLDHGIEPPDQRGEKPRCATLTIACGETPDAWVVQLADDGRGIDVEAVVQAAIARGAVAAESARAMTRDEQLRLIFLDGVTTRDVATLESGRGVGAAAVLESVEALGGEVEIRTTPGQGTRFTLWIPRA